MKVLKILFVLLFTILATVITYAQGGKISGKVTEKGTGEPMPGVNIILLGTEMGAATDFNGEYFILNIPPGTYELKASTIGYKTVTQTNVVVSVNQIGRASCRERV